MDFIVVPIGEAQLVRVGIGMLYAQKNSYPYPMPGPTYYIWDPQPNVAGTHVAFGSLDSLGGDDIGFGEWCLGRELSTSLGTLTLPAAAETLESSWFAPPPSPGG